MVKLKKSSLLLVFIFVCGCYESNLPDDELSALAYANLTPKERLQFDVDVIDHARAGLKTLDLSDGVSFEEANTIFDNFIYTNKAFGCGALGNVVDNGKFWKAATFVGFAAKRSYPIFIDKKTGALTRNGELLFSSPDLLIFEDPLYYTMAKENLLKIAEFKQQENLEDPRIPNVKLSNEYADTLLDQVNSLANENKICFDEFIDDYQNKVLKHCQEAGYADDISGGCYHVVGYSQSNALFLKALESCGVEVLKYKPQKKPKP